MPAFFTCIFLKNYIKAIPTQRGNASDENKNRIDVFFVVAMPLVIISFSHFLQNFSLIT